MNFQTKIPLSKQTHNLISYDSSILLLGSCFAENISTKFNYFKFKSLTNPFGILFHPLAIEQFITNVINEKHYTDEDVFQLNEQWHCFEAHSRLSSTSKAEVLKHLNHAIDSTIQQLNNSTHIVITLGTAWGYRHIASDSIVANCHKVPQKQFLKELLTIDEISESLESIISLIRSVNKDIKFIFTVSPVRHLKDGFVENQRSKSHLLSALHQVIEPRLGSYYFPSYELMMDELRDYRFYAEDMIHPNQLAIDYIWEAFKTVWIEEKTISLMQNVDDIQKGLAHKPFNPNSEAHQKFLKTIEEKKAKLKDLLPDIGF